MIALDTNVVVRLVTNDDPAQVKAAKAYLQGETLFLAKTVLLETEWVLRFSYGLSHETIAVILQRLLGLEGTRVEDRTAVLRALSWYGRGLDFADALHAASSGDAERFVTFDRPLAREARGLVDRPSIELLT
jgi:predicted nucleic-acid-binding protein